MASTSDSSLPAQLASFAVKMRNSRSVKSAAEILLEAGQAIGLPTPTFVDDIHSDLPVEFGSDCNLAQGVLGWHPTMLRWWYGDKVGLRHIDVQRLMVCVNISLMTLVLYISLT